MFIEHVNLTVSNLDASVRFYEELFGFKTRWRGISGGGQEAAHVGTDRYYLALFQADEEGERTLNMHVVGLNHFGVVVDDLDASLGKLRSLGREPHHVTDYEPGRRAYFLDRDGIEVELVSYASDATPGQGGAGHAG